MKNKAQKNNWLGLIGVAILVGLYILMALIFSKPTLKGSAEEITVPKITATAISWPAYGEAAVGAAGQGLISTSNEQKSAPIASIAKTILALSVLKEKPLAIGEQGPLYTITQNDIDLYKSNLAQNGSVMPIKLNDQLSEYQLLQGLLIPSGDNIADTLAIWTFGSMENYLAYANDLVAKLGLKSTHLDDAGGLSSTTVSSASDLVTIGEKLLADPVLAQIVGLSQAELPVIGVTKNYNTLLGSNGVIGIKTGNTDEAGGCLLSAYKQNIGGKDETIILAILGASSRAKVLNDTTNFINNNKNALQLVDIIKAGQVIGTYSTPWGKDLNIVAKEDALILAINKEEITFKSNFSDLKKSVAKNSDMGNLIINAGPSEISVIGVLENKYTSAPFWWKLLHPFSK